MFRHVTTRVSGLIILIAGIWGALIPFVGPYFHFVLGPDQHWKWTTGRLWLNVLPGVVAALGGLILMGGGPRVSGRFGALMALAAGIWFIVGPDVSLLWNHGVSAAGAPHGTHRFKRFLELLTFHSGLGALITTFAAYSIPGVTYVTRGRVGRDAELAGAGAAGAAAEHHHDRRVAEREGAAAPAGEPVAQREGGHSTGTVAGAGVAGAAAGAAAEHHHDHRVAERETGAGAEPVTQQQAGPGGGGVAPNGTAEEGAGTRRRGGLAGFFGRR